MFPDTALASCDIDLLLDAVHSVKIWQKEPPLKPGAYYHSVSLHIQLIG